MNKWSTHMADKRPLAVTAVAFLFIILPGIIGLIYHVMKLIEEPSVDYEVWVILLRILALVTGIFLLRGANWARWLALAWMAYHVVLGMYHSVFEALVHLALLAVIAFLLFIPKSSAFFRQRQPV